MKLKSTLTELSKPKMMLSRAKPAVQALPSTDGNQDKKQKMPTLDMFVHDRDFLGAITLLEVTFKIM